MSTLRMSSGVLLVLFVACALVLLLPSTARAVFFTSFQSLVGGVPVTTTASAPLHYGSGISVSWSCSGADGSKVWDFYPNGWYPTAGNVAAGAGAGGTYNVVLYSTKTYYAGCQDNRTTNFDYAWAGPLTVHVAVCPQMEAVDAYRYRLPANSVRRASAFGFNHCVTNSNGYDLFIPAGSSTEYTNFINNLAPNVTKGSAT